MIEISRAHDFRPAHPPQQQLGLDLKSLWSQVAPTIQPAVTNEVKTLLTPGTPATAPPGTLPIVPPPSSGTILGMPTGLVVAAGILAAGAGAAIYFLSKD